MKNKIHSLIVEGILFCGSGLGLLSYSMVSYGRAFNKSWAQSLYLFPLIVGAAMTGLSLWIVGEGIQAMRKRAGEETAPGSLPQTAKTRAARIQAADGQDTEAGTENAQSAKNGGTVSQILGVAIALVLCGIYYLALAGIKIPYVTIGIFSFMYTFSTFEVVTVPFLASMMAFMGVRKARVLVLVPLGTTLFLSIAFRTLLHVLLP